MYNLNDYKDVLIEFYNLACKERGLIKTDEKSISDISVEDIATIYDNSDIVIFLNKQSLDCIKVIQAVMYVGRDYVEADYKDSNDILNEFIENLSIGNESDDREIIISTIYDKGPLCTYLLDGLTKLNIEL